jgi:hypothetical protein
MKVRRRMFSGRKVHADDNSIKRRYCGQDNLLFNIFHPVSSGGSAGAFRLTRVTVYQIAECAKRIDRASSITIERYRPKRDAQKLSVNDRPKPKVVINIQIHRMIDGNNRIKSKKIALLLILDLLHRKF